MKQSELFDLLYRCLLLQNNPELKGGINEKFVSGKVNIDAFVLLASNHLVLPAVYIRLFNTGLIKHFTAEYAEHLKEIYLLNRIRNREILQQITEISEALLTENIQPVYLKGTANLMDNLYTDLGDRMIGDIDFLVQETDYLKTAEVVCKLGYKTDSPFYDDVKIRKHYPRLFKENVPADIEIHWMPVNREFSKKFNSATIFPEKKKISDRVNCFVPTDRHKFIHTFIHSQLSNSGYRFKEIVLRDLYDYYLLSQRVNVLETIQDIEENSKAQTFYHFTRQLLNPEKSLDFSPDKKTRKFFAIHRWFLNHPKQRRFYIRILKLYDLIFKRYLLRIGTAFFQKSSFRYIVVRLKDPHWYKKHFAGLKDYFS